MYTVYLALGLALFVSVVPTLLGMSAVWTVPLGILLGIVSFVWINRRMAKRVQAVTEAADAEMATLQQLAQRPGPATQVAMGKKFDRAIELLKRGFLFEKWQIGVGTMLNARIGMLYFTKWLVTKKSSVSDAIPYLEKSRIKGKKARLLQALWPAWAMLAVAYYRGKKDLDSATKVLEETVVIAKKQGLLWNLYAWILWKEKRLDDAVDVLARAKEAVPDDPHVTENLTALQNRKKPNMRGYGEQWYQFGLEQPRAAAAGPRMGHPRMRGKGRRR
jgi:tetratricopeptide (TPR) repeat protein